MHLFNGKTTLAQVGQPTPTQVDPTTLTLISGRNIAHTPRTASQRAAVAAMLVRGEAELIDPTVTHAAALLRVSVPYVYAALGATADERVDLALGKATVSEVAPSPAAALCREWRRAAPHDLVEFVRRVGVDEVFDNGITPAINGGNHG